VSSDLLFDCPISPNAPKPLLVRLLNQFIGNLILADLFKESAQKNSRIYFRGTPLTPPSRTIAAFLPVERRPSAPR
jgi:hypothetical protein